MLGGDVGKKMTRGDYATGIVKTLREAGHEAYLCGGCVRDMVLGVEPLDYDIATSAVPETVMDLFPRTEPIGAKFGVVLVICGGLPFEVATFRSDEAYTDGRRPSGVVFTDARQDVLRRDFTINGLLYDPLEDRIIDYVGGQDDIGTKTVRAIGNARERFREDKLRVLRAVRFGARLGYRIEPDTWDAVREMASEIGQVSQERIRDELVRILTEGEASRGIRLLEESGLATVVLPEWSWTRQVDKMLDTMNVPVQPDFATAVLLHECAAEDVERIAARLRFSNREAAHIHTLVRDQHRFSDVELMSTAALKRFLRSDRFDDHLELHRLRQVVTHGDLETLRFIRDRLADWAPEELSPRPLLTGDDLISLGFRPGPSFTHILMAVEDEQLEGRITDHASALAFVRSRFV